MAETNGAAVRERKRAFWQRLREIAAQAKESVTDADRAKQPANQATSEMVAAINELPDSVRAAQLFKIGRMLSKAPALLVFVGDVRPAATGTVQDEGSLLYPTQRYLNAIAAVRAGKTDWDLPLVANFHPIELRDIAPWRPRWPKQDEPTVGWRQRLPDVDAESFIENDQGSGRRA